MKKRVFTIFMIFIMLFSQLSLFVFANDVSSLEIEDNKMTKELRECLEMASDEEYISVYVTLKNYDENEVYSLLSKKQEKIFHEKMKRSIFDQKQI